MGTIASTKSAIDYRYPHERDGCTTCAHSAFIKEGERGPHQRGGLECSRYGFWVQPQAMCSRHEPKVQEGGAA